MNTVSLCKKIQVFREMIVFLVVARAFSLFC